MTTRRRNTRSSSFLLLARAAAATKRCSSSSATMRRSSSVLLLALLLPPPRATAALAGAEFFPFIRLRRPRSSPFAAPAGSEVIPFAAPAAAGAEVFPIRRRRRTPHQYECTGRSGGVVLAFHITNIVCENTLDARLEVVFRKKLPEASFLDPERILRMYCTFSSACIDTMQVPIQLKLTFWTLDHLTSRCDITTVIATYKPLHSPFYWIGAGGGTLICSLEIQ
uniref:Uncharacterized protein n=1 Tax=Oryza glumipatula TaxID=40148 RepID=A0A0E0AJ72_9ORYZ